MNGYLIYDRSDAEINAWFIEHFIATAKEFGHNLVLKYTDEALTPYPDFAIVRARDYKINEKLEENDVLVFNNSFLSLVANDKEISYKLAELYRLDIMPTFYSLPNELSFPFVVKDAFGHGGTQVFLVNDEAQLKTALGKIQKPIFQAVCSDMGKDLRVYVLNNEIVACMLRESRDDFRSNFCLGGSAKVYEPNEEELCVIKKAMSMFDINFAGIDFIFHNGKLMFNEVEDAVGSRMLYSLTDIDIVKLWFMKTKLEKF